MGGVSLWCDQLIRGMPQYRWEVVALTVDGSERELWQPPDNLEYTQSIPMWGPAPPRRRRRSGPPGTAFTSAYEGFLTALMNPLDPRSDQAAVSRSRFLLALRGLYEYTAQGGELADALTTNQGLAQMMDAWHGVYEDGLTLADAIEAAWLIERMLRPLSVRPVAADIVHASMNGLSMLVAMATKWRHGTPVVMSEHGIYLRERYLSLLEENVRRPVKILLLNFFRALAGAGYLIADVLAPHSSYNRRWQLQNGAHPDRMWTMYNGVAPDEFPAAESEPDRPTIVFMGRIDPLKDLHTLIRAFATVRAQVPRARLRIFGGTPPGNELYRASCVQLISDLGLRDSVAMEGKVDSPVAAYHAGTIVALTSISEGFPYTVVEAMACGRAVVCTNVGGVAEAVADAGLVVSPRDHVAIANACVRLLSDDDLRRKMATNARSRFLELFTLRRSLDAYQKVYRQLTDGAVHELVVPKPPETGARRRAEPRPRVRGQASVTARGHAPAAHGRASVAARGTTSVAAWGMGSVATRGSASVTAHGRASVPGVPGRPDEDAA